METKRCAADNSEAYRQNYSTNQKLLKTVIMLRKQERPGFIKKTATSHAFTPARAQRYQETDKKYIFVLINFLFS